MKHIKLFLLFIIVFIFLFSSCATNTASAEEYYSIGMAYYAMEKFDEAERWLLRAQAADRTKTASEYQLGRIAFAGSRFTEAARYFDSILKKDENNVLALEAAAYTNIKLGDIENALKLYDRVLALIPENADDGYNYALVLYAAGKYSESEEVIKKYNFSAASNKDAQLLLARVQSAQNKPEAIDSYALLLDNSADAEARCEFARILEKNEFYVRAIEEYKKAVNEVTKETETFTKAGIRFETARLLFITGGDTAETRTEALTELEGAISAGFKDISKIDALLSDSRLSSQTKDSIRTATADLRTAQSGTGSTP